MIQDQGYFVVVSRPLNATKNELTPRQRQVLVLAARGATHKEIARRLGITSKTARNHLANLYQNLEVHTRAEAAICAVRLGLIEANASSTLWPPDPTMVTLNWPIHRRPQEGVNGRSS